MEERRQREEAARLEALRQAEIERARIAAEEEARLVAMREQQAHAQKLAQITQDKSKKKLTYAIVGVVALVLVGGGAAAYFGIKASDEAKARDAANLAQIEKAKEEALLAEKTAQALQAKQADLMEQLKNATSEAARLKIQTELDAAAAAAAAAKTGGSRGGGAAKPGDGASTPKPASNCAPGDPLCGM